MKVGSCLARKGEISFGELRVATDAKAGPIAIPLVIARGREDGKRRPVPFRGAVGSYWDLKADRSGRQAVGPFR